MQIDKPRCDLQICRNYLDGNCLRDYEICNYPRYKTVNEKIEHEGYTLCKVDEAVEKMKELMQKENEGEMYYYPPYYSERCIKILKGACK